MSGVAKHVGAVAGVVATVAAFIPGGQVVAAAAGAIAAVSNTVAQLTAKPPAARGRTTQVVIDPNSPTPYSMGFTYVAGHKVHEEAYGPDRKQVPNPNKSAVYIYSIAGPIEGFSQFFNDFIGVNATTSGNVPGYYNDHLWIDWQKGETPEPRALTNLRDEYNNEMVDWGPNHKLSGYAAACWSYRFDRDGEIFAGGTPPPGATGEWVKCYDPRLDNTYEGGAGPHRIDDESTWAYTANPALHALTYIYGRYSQNPARPGKIFGIGMPVDAIKIDSFVHAANVNDENGWVLGGTIYEPGDKWNNLKLIMEAGGMIPVWDGALLGCSVHAPMVAVDIITEDDLAEGEWVVPAMQPWRNRQNIITPEFRSREHQWEHVPADALRFENYIVEDGEEKPGAYKFELTQDANIATQLAAYRVMDAREIGPIILPLKPRFLSYATGTCIHIRLPDLALDHTCEVRGVDYDIESGVVKMSFITNDIAKHDFALGRTGTPPPTTRLIGGEEVDMQAFTALAEVIRERVLTSEEFGDLQAAIGNVPDEIAAAVGQAAIIRNQAISDALDAFEASDAPDALDVLDAAVDAANEAYQVAIGLDTPTARAQATEQAIQLALTSEAADRAEAIQTALDAFAAGEIDEAGLNAAIDEADASFNLAIGHAVGAEQSARADAIVAAVGVTEARRDEMIAQATAEFNAGLITQAGLDAQVAEANALFDRSLDAARGNIFQIQNYIANDTQIIRNNDNAIEGVRYFDENGAEVVTPYNVFWEAFRLVTETGASSTPFLYDPIADVVYFDTVFVQDLSVETIHIRDGAISQAYTLSQSGNANDPVEMVVRNADLSVVPGKYFYRDRVDQSQNSGPQTTFNSRRAHIGDPLVIPAGLFAGQTIFLNVSITGTHAQNNGGMAIELRLFRDVYLDAALTQRIALADDPRPFTSQVGVDVFTLVTAPNNLNPTQESRTFVDVHIPADREVWMVYRLVARILGPNGNTINDAVYFTECNWSAILSKR